MSQNKCSIQMIRGLCGRDIVSNNRCIFHLQNKNDKQSDLFEIEFRKELERLLGSPDEIVDLTSFVFPRPVSIGHWMMFKKPIYLTDTVFEGTADLSGATFDAMIVFTGTKFNGEANFAGTTFAQADFRGAKFKGATFTGAKFMGASHFSDAQFEGKADFVEARFDSVYFDRSKFGEADFYNTEFREAHFSWAEFEKAFFFQAKFQKAYFYATKFKEANFLMATFEEAYFGPAIEEFLLPEGIWRPHDGAEFKEWGNFSWAKFQEAHFGRTRFKKATFDVAMFRGKANFLSASFEEAQFRRTEFEGDAYFGYAFSRPSNAIPASKISGLHAAEFSGTADFAGANFKAAAHFLGTKMKDAQFIGAVFENSADFSGADFGNAIFFRRVRFLHPESVVFDNVDLSKISFLYTDDIVGVQFIDLTPSKKKGRQWIGSDRYFVLDEDRIGQKEEEATYVNVGEVYRRLRRNFESKLRYSDAGEFFRGEMEMRRMNISPENNIVSRLRRNMFSTIGWYNILSSYGESPTRVAICSLIVFGAFALCRFLVTPIPVAPCFTQIFSSICSVIERTFLVFFQLKSEDFADSLERILSALLLGLAAVTLRRQLERHR